MGICSSEIPTYSQDVLLSRAKQMKRIIIRYLQSGTKKSVEAQDSVTLSSPLKTMLTNISFKVQQHCTEGRSGGRNLQVFQQFCPLPTMATMLTNISFKTQQHCEER